LLLNLKLNLKLKLKLKLRCLVNLRRWGLGGCARGGERGERGERGGGGERRRMEEGR